MVKRVPKGKNENRESLGKTGRPRLENKTKFEPEEELFWQYRIKGYSLEEAAEEVGLSLRNAERLSANPIVKKKIKHGRIDKESDWRVLEEIQYEEALKASIKRLNQGKAGKSEIADIIARFEAKLGIGPKEDGTPVTGSKKQPEKKKSTIFDKGDKE